MILPNTSPKRMNTFLIVGKFKTSRGGTETSDWQTLQSAVKTFHVRVLYGLAWLDVNGIDSLGYTSRGKSRTHFRPIVAANRHRRSTCLGHLCQRSHHPLANTPARNNSGAETLQPTSARGHLADEIDRHSWFGAIRIAPGSSTRSRADCGASSERSAPSSPYARRTLLWLIRSLGRVTFEHHVVTGR